MGRLMRLLVIILSAVILCLAAAFIFFMKGGNSGMKTFTNPIVTFSDTPDPWIIHKDGYYYLTFTTGANINVWKSKSLVDWEEAKKQMVWLPPVGTEHSYDIWAPELHWINGKWYIYFAADDGQNPSHRMYVLESKTSDALGEYEFKGKIADPKHDYWAIDGTVLEWDGKRYFIWSGWERESATDLFPQNLYMAPMANPWTLGGERQLISTPEYDWEKQGAAINEGPAVLKKDGKVFLAYSASGSWTPDYKVGLLTLEAGTDPMVRENWIKSPEPVFKRNDAEGVYGPGHVSFTTSPDQEEVWMVYHATSGIHDGWDNRKARLQKITWTEDGKPEFGIPKGSETPIEVPSR
ncbi:MAG TPA: glycoside hydrolase family 43 protein [Bacillales bacterium]